MSGCRFAAALVAAFILLSFAGPAVASPAPDPLVVRDCDFGEVYAFSAAGCAITLENNGATSLAVSIAPVQQRNTADPTKLTLAPHARARVATHVVTDDIAGQIAWSFRITRGGGAPRFARASGFVMSVLDNPRPKIDFGSVDPGDGPAMKSVELASSVAPGLRVTRILSIPDFVRAKIGKDGKTLVAEIGRDMPWGPFDGIVKLAIDTPQQKQVWVEVKGSVNGEIAPDKNPYWFGTVPWNPQRTLTVPLIDRAGRDFTIGTVTAKDFAATYDSADCKPARPGCKALLIHVADSQPAGFFKSELDVVLPDRDQHLTVTIWGILEARSLPGQKESAPGVTKLEAPKAGSDDSAPPPPLKVQTEPPGKGPLLKWTVAHQSGVHGYQVFRGDSPRGPFALMGKGTLPVLDNGKGPVKYQWRDTSAVAGRTYWYYIAVVYRTGGRQALTGPQKTVAK